MSQYYFNPIISKGASGIYYLTLPFPREPVGVKGNASSSKLSSSKLRDVGGGSGDELCLKERECVP